MKIDFKGLLEGAWNSVFVKENIEKIAEERLEICKGCSHNSDHAKKFNNYKTIRPDFHCTLCGCDLHMKTRCLSCECPIKKWLVQVSEGDDALINEKLKDDTD